MNICNKSRRTDAKIGSLILNFYDFIQVFVYTTNHHLKVVICGKYINLNKITKI